MASNRIKGITIEIDGNVTPLTKALKDVDKSLKDTQTELNDVNRLLKLDPSNVELLRQKNNLLSDAVSKTKERQQELIKALDQAKKAGDTEENRKQQDALQRELIETTQNLEKMEKELSGTGSATNEANKSASTFADTLKAKLTGEAIISAVKKLASGLKDLATSAITLSDDLATQAQVTGLSTDALQEYNYMAELVDVSVDTITGSMTKLTRNMKSAQSGTGTAASAFQKLHVRVTNLDGSLRSNQDVFNDVIDSLGNVANETERDALAMEIFGKSAQELNPLIEAGSNQIRSYAQEAHDMGYVMSEDVIAKNVQASDAYQRMQNSITAAKNEIGSELAPVIGRAAETIQKLIQAARDNKDVVEKVIGVIAAAAAGFIAYEAAVTAASAATALMAANPATLLITALAALATAAVVMSGANIQLSEDTLKLVGSINECTDELDRNIQAFDKLEDAKEKNIAAAESESKYYTDLADELSTIVDENGKVKDGYQDRAKVITGVLSDALGVEIEMTGDQIKNYQQIQQEVYGVIEAKKAEAILKAQEQAYTEAVTKRAEAEVTLLKSVNECREAKERVGEIDKELLPLIAQQNDLNAQAAGGWDSQQQAIADQIKALTDEKNALSDAVSTNEAKIKEYQDTVAGYNYNIQQYESNLALAHEKEYGKMNTVTADLVRQYQTATTDVKAQLDAQYGNLIAEASRIYDASYQNGVNVIYGMRDGTNNWAAQQAAYGAVRNFSQGLLNTSRQTLMIQSPSKATKKMGEYLVEGFGVGIEAESQSLYNEIAAFGRNTVTAFQAATGAGFSANAGLMTSSAGLGASAGGVGDVNVSVTVNGNVDNYDAMAETIGQKLQQQMARQQRVWA